MPSVAQITVVVLAFAGAVVSSPAELRKRSSFTVEQVSAKAVPQKSGAQKKVATFRRYGLPVDARLAAAAEKTQKKAMFEESAVSSGSVSAWQGALQSRFFSPITVGKDTVHVLFDTGSSDLWVGSTLQPPEQIYHHDIYHPDISKAKKGYTWSILYGDDGTADGDVYVDKVQAGPFVVPNQAVGAARNVTGFPLQQSELDGILGLGFRKLNSIQPVQQDTWFDNLKPSLAAPLFAVALRYDAPGSYDFGIIDASKYKGTLAYTEVNSNRGYWNVYVTDNSILNSDFVALVDTGTAIILLRPDYVEAYYAKIPGAYNDDESGGYVFPCSTKLPDVWFKIGGAKHTVAGGNLIDSRLYSDPTMCYGALQASYDSTHIVLGTPFIVGKYIVHEYKNGMPRMGIAPLANP
ncbi:acid protease [Pyrenophora teres f. maculata]|nr:acid protease [Pyrenophora teres f. maculata]